MGNVNGDGSRRSGPTAVAAQDLGLRLGGSDVLGGVDFRLQAGQVLALLGPNGAGKTSLLKVLATLLRPTRGSLTILGRDPRLDPIAVRRQVGYVAHQTFLYPQLTGWENLWFWSRVNAVDRPAARVKQLLEFVGLDLYADDPVRHFSRGMQQRLALARALLPEPSLLLLDEPYTGLDSQASKLLDEVVAASRRQGRTVVITSHDPRHALAVSDRVLVLNRGRVSLEAPSREIEVGWLEAACAGAIPLGGGGPK